MTALRAYRDDGPLGELIGRAGRGVAVDETALCLAGAVLLAVAAALAGPVLGLGGLAAAAAVAVAIVELGSRRPHRGRVAWLVPPLVRGLEYAFLIRLTAVAERDAMPLCFALLGVLAVHHYDTVYRLRHRRVRPPAWLRLAAGGWDGRVLAACALALAGVLGPGLLVAALGLGALFLGEIVVSWTRFTRAHRSAVDEERAA